MTSPRFVLLSAVLATATHIAFAQPALTHAVPAAARPGQAVDITLHGAKLDGILNFWSSFPAKIELVPVPAEQKDVASRVCKVTLDGQVPVGIGGIIVANPAGTSDPLFVMVDDLPSVADSGQNHAAAQAQVLTLPVAVDGACDGTAFDYYKFAAKKDQRVSVEVIAARMASALDPIVRLLDAAGKELLLADDDPSFGADCRFSIAIPADGEYVLELRDNQFRGGGRYRLRVGDFPLVSAPYPLGGRFGSTMRFRFSGPMADAALPVFLRIPDDGPAGRQSIAAKLANGQSSGMATIVTSRLPDIVEAEPNNDLKVATLTSLPCAVNGTFQEARDRDFYQFAATKGQAMQFRAVSRSLGSPSYLMMRILNADGGQLAESPINDADETTVSFTFPADGMYGLSVEDLLNRGGPEFAYRVEIEPNDGFSLTLKQEPTTRTKFTPPTNNGGLALTMTVARRGYDGPIQLAIEAPVAGYSLLNGIIPEKAAEHRVVILAPAGQAVGALNVLRMVGTATINGRAFQTAMATTPALKARWPQMSFPPTWIDTLLTASVVAELPAFYNVTSSANPIKFTRAQGMTQFNLTLERKNAEFKEAINVFVSGLPSGFTSAVKPDKDVYQVTITGPKDAAPSKHSLRLVMYGEFKGSGQALPLELPLEIAD